MERNNQTPNLTKPSPEVEEALNTLPSIVRYIANNAQVVWSNLQWNNFTGQAENESLGSCWQETIHPDDRDTAIQTIVDSYNNQEPYSIEYRIRKKDQDYLPHLEKAKPIHSKNGVFIGFTSIITSIQGINDDHKQQYLNLRNLVESAPFPIGVYTGPEMKIALANKSIKEIFGKGDDVVGRLYPELLPELEGTGIFEQLKQVYETGIPFESENKFLNITEKGIDRPFYFNYIFTPLFDEQRNIYGVMNTAADVTELNLAKVNIEHSEARFRALIEEAPVATCLFIGRKLRIEIANEEMIQIWGKGNSILGKPLAEALPELKGQHFLEILDNIFDTGETYQAKDSRADLVMDGKLKTFYFDFTYKPLFDQNGKVYGIIDMAIDVTERTLASRRIEEMQQQLISSFEQSPVGIAILDRENLVFTMANPFYCELVGKKSKEIINKSLFDALPELKGREFDQLLYGVIETGIAYTANEVEVAFLRNGKMETIFVNFTYQPQYKSDGSISGVFVVVIDVTQQVISRKEVEASEAKLRSVIMNAPAGIGLFVGRDLIVQLPNRTFIDIVGKGPDIEGKPLREVMPELITEGQPFLKILDDVYTTGIMFQSYGSQVKIVQDGMMTYNYYNITYSPLFDENNEVYAIMDIAIDVTDTVLAKQKAEEAEASLRGAVELAELATWSLDVKNNTFSYSSRFMEWLGFSDDIKNMEEAYNPLPDEFKQQVAEKIREALQSETGVYKNEHPIINRITGQTRIISAQAQVFYDNDGNPEFLSGSAQDVTQERELQRQLEYEVKKRTEELQEANAGLAEAIDSLQKTNDELAQFAYIASHDLQEPIRKISIFSKMLEDSLVDIDSQSLNYLSKINVSTNRMMNLIRDILAYSQLSKEQQAFEAVDLNVIIQNVISDFDFIIEQKKAIVAYNELPVIEAIPLQMTQLFANLISNSLKYSRTDFNPIINITASILSEEEAVEHGIYEAGRYYKLEFRDNGIGFHQEHASQIFNIFQRLHGKTQYDGTGIGLAICKKIAQNHHGDIYAQADHHKGALFVVLLPFRQNNQTIHT